MAVRCRLRHGWLASRLRTDRCPAVPAPCGVVADAVPAAARPVASDLRAPVVGPASVGRDLSGRGRADSARRPSSRCRSLPVDVPWALQDPAPILGVSGTSRSSPIDDPSPVMVPATPLRRYSRRSQAWPSRFARARRLPSCIAATRATGICLPSAISAEGIRWGTASASPHGSRPPNRFGAVMIVKSPGATSSSSSHAIGNETGTPGRARGLYAAITVAPPVRVESMNTLPSRSALRNAVVAVCGRGARHASRSPWSGRLPRPSARLARLVRRRGGLWPRSSSRPRPSPLR